MRNLPRPFRPALAIAAVVAAVLLACTSDTPTSPTAIPSDSATAANVPPALTPTPSATPWPQGVVLTPTPLPTSGLADSRAIIDEVIEAVTTGDVDHLESLIRYQDIACGGDRSGPAGPPYPSCQGAPRSSLVPAFPAGVCHAVWHRDARPMLERFVDRAGPDAGPSGAVAATIRRSGTTASSSNQAPWASRSAQPS